MSGEHTRVYFENRTMDTLYLSIKAKSGTLEINVYHDPTPGAREFKPRHITSYVIDDRIRSCITNNKLSFEVINHGQTICFTPGRFKMPDGQILTFCSPDDPLDD
ncbi:MAG: hypothetical protein WCT10_01360 [Patescibacteria group bacterium]|jgi:hypothetical protein